MPRPFVGEARKKAHNQCLAARQLGSGIGKLRAQNGDATSTVSDGGRFAPRFNVE